MEFNLKMSRVLAVLEYVLFSMLIVVDIFYLLKYIRYLQAKQFHLMMFAIIFACLVFELISVPLFNKAESMVATDPNHNLDEIRRKYYTSSAFFALYWLLDNTAHIIFAMKYWVLSRKINQI
jgi:hypothetical protein